MLASGLLGILLVNLWRKHQELCQNQTPGEVMGWWNNKGRRDPMGKLAPLGEEVERARRLLPVFRHHPCDQCGVSEIDGKPIAHANHEIVTSQGSIFLCSHHFRDHGVHVLERGYETRGHGEGAGT
jgi:hypothetical protein